MYFPTKAISFKKTLTFSQRRSEKGCLEYFSLRSKESAMYLLVDCLPAVTINVSDDPSVNTRTCVSSIDCIKSVIWFYVATLELSATLLRIRRNLFLAWKCIWILAPDNHCFCLERFDSASDLRTRENCLCFGPFGHCQSWRRCQRTQRSPEAGEAGLVV